MKTYKGLPVAKPKFSDDDEVSGLDIVSYVSKPAIMEKGIMLSDVIELESVKMSEEKRQVLAPVLIPDIYILRKTKRGVFYYLQFSEEDIVRLRDKWMRNPKKDAFNSEHTDKMAPSFLLENWIKEDLVYDKSVKYGMDHPVGTLYFLTQVTSEEYWDEIKTKGMNAFSIEAYLDIEFFEEVSLKEELANPGLVHPNCLCGVRGGVWDFNYYGDATTDSPSPCPKCIKAKDIFERTGRIPDLTELEDECECFVDVNSGETKDEFVSRCMGSKKMNDEFPDQAQRAAVCYSKWDQSKMSNVFSYLKNK